MRAVTYQGIKSLSVDRVREPEIERATDAIVKVELAGICGSDLHVYNGRETGLDKGTIMGHEFMGTVVETGSDINSIITGNRVISPFFSSCGGCFYCNENLACRCESGQLFGWRDKGEGLHGTQTEYVRVPMADTTLQPLREGIDALHGLMLGDILPTAFFCTDMVKPVPGKPYAVIGCGPVGQLIVMALRSRGVEQIYALDLSQDRLKLAESMGAIPVNPDSYLKIIDDTKGIGVEAVLEAVGNPSSQELAYKLVRKGGTISVVGVHNEPHFSFAPVDLYDKNLTYMTGRCPVQNYIPEIESLIRKGTDFSHIISHRISIEDAVDAYSKFNDRIAGYTKVVIDPSL